MKNRFRTLAVVSALTLSTFSVSSVVQPTQAHALVGIFTWPLLIVGAALEGAAAVTGLISADEYSRGHFRHADDLGAMSFFEAAVGLFFLDDQTGSLSLREVTPAQRAEIGLTEQEMKAYNKAVANGNLDEILQRANNNLPEKATVQDAQTEMKEALTYLNQEARDGFCKVSAYIVKKQQEQNHHHR